MKGSKLFASIAALALVIGLGACSETEDETLEGEEESPSSSGGGILIGPGTSSGDDGNTSSGGSSSVNATTPAELVQRVAEEGNYSVEIEYDLYESNGTITYSEYPSSIKW